MTVCIAALYENGKGCILASDQMTTAHFPIGYEFENDEVEKIVKIGISGDVSSLIAGDVIFASEVLTLVKKTVTEQSVSSVAVIAELVRGAYQEVRRTHILRNEFESRGLTLETYYQNQQRLVGTIVQILDNALRNYNPSVSLLIAGKGEKTCQLFTVVNPGEMICNDVIGYTAIGSGAPHAVYSLIDTGYKKSMPKEKVEELVKQAKKRSEVAPGVGGQTRVVSIP